MTEIRTTGVYVVGECDLKLPGCRALEPAPITVIKLQPSGKQVNVCSSCLQEMLDRQEWQAVGAGFEARYDFALVSKENKALLVLEVKRAPAGAEVDQTHWARAYVRNLAAHGKFQPSALLILSVLDGLTTAWRTSNVAPYPSLIATIDTREAFVDLGLDPPQQGLDERFSQAFYADFIERLVTSAPLAQHSWIANLGLNKLPLSGATVKSEVQL